MPKRYPRDLTSIGRFLAACRRSPRAGDRQDLTPYEAERIMAMLRDLSPVERDTRLRLLSTVVLPWRRLYDGLAPDVQRDFRPVGEFMDRLHNAAR